MRGDEAVIGMKKKSEASEWWVKLTVGGAHTRADPNAGVQVLTYLFGGPVSGAQVACSALNAEIPWARERLLGTKFLSG